MVTNGWFFSHCVLKMLSWVDKADTHPRAGPSILQSLEETLRDWGLSQTDDIISIIEKWAKTALQTIMEYQSELAEMDRGGPHARTDIIGAEHNELFDKAFVFSK